MVDEKGFRCDICKKRTKKVVNDLSNVQRCYECEAEQREKHIAYLNELIFDSLSPEEKDWVINNKSGTYQTLIYHAFIRHNNLGGLYETPDECKGIFNFPNKRKVQ